MKLRVDGGWRYPFTYRQYVCEPCHANASRFAEAREWAQLSAAAGPRAERSEATRAALVTAARRLFGERGFAGVGTEEIVRAAGVTRGALYHHFAGKKELLEAAYRQVEEELTGRVADVVLGSGAESPTEAMRMGVSVFLDACAEPEVQRIVLLDAPAVLGWDRWREIASDYGLGLIEASLAAAIEAGEIPEQPVKPLAHLLMGALDEAAMLVARSEDPAVRDQVSGVLERLLAGIAADATQAGRLRGPR